MKQIHSTFESLKSLESLGSHLQVLGESLFQINSLKKILMQHAVSDKNKQQKIDDIILITMLTIRL